MSTKILAFFFLVFSSFDVALFFFILQGFLVFRNLYSWTNIFDIKKFENSNFLKTKFNSSKMLTFLSVLESPSLSVAIFAFNSGCVRLKVSKIRLYAFSYKIIICFWPYLVSLTVKCKGRHSLDNPGMINILSLLLNLMLNFEFNGAIFFL